jgi:hypothetical protein
MNPAITRIEPEQHAVEELELNGNIGIHEMTTEGLLETAIVAMSNPGMQPASASASFAASRPVRTESGNACAPSDGIVSCHARSN